MPSYVATLPPDSRRTPPVVGRTVLLVTQSIHNLERHCGLQLFKQSGRRMELTHAGRVLFRCARRIFEAAEKAEQAIRELSTVARGELRVGTTKIYARYLMPSAISSFRERHPEVTVLLDEGSSEQMVQSVEQPASGRLVALPLPGPPVTLETDVVTMEQGPPSPAVRAFLHVLQESATADWNEPMG